MAKTYTCDNADKILPVNKRPKCKNCKKPLRPDINYIFPTPITSRAVFNGAYGKYGNNHFCNLDCGFAWGRSIADSLTSGTYRISKVDQ